MYVLTIEALAATFPKTPRKTLEKFLPHLNKTFKDFKFDTALSVRSFLSQVGHESGGFKFVEENLNYSEEGLRKVFGKYFTAALAKQYARKPEKIASRVYANRMGNGDEASKDGWTFRGRGLIQITGKNNYTALSKFLGLSLADTVKYLSTDEGATVSAGWFFAANGLMSLANVGAVTKLTKAINGGYNGLEDRLDIFSRSKQFIKD